MIAELQRLDMIAELEAMDASQQPQAAPEPPGFLEGRLAGVRGGFNELVATGADALATPGRVIASFAGIDPEKASIDFAGIPLTDIAKDQRGAALMERGIQQQATPKGGAAQFGTELLDAAINMAPSVATSYLTKSPNLPLAVMGGQVFSTELTRSMNEGKSRDEALKDAGIATVNELGMEKAFGFFDDLPVTQGAKAWLRQVVAESVSEAATETLNITDERYRQGEDIGTFWDTLLRTGKAGAMGAAMGGGFAAPTLLRGQEPQVTPNDPVMQMVEAADAAWKQRVANEGQQQPQVAPDTPLAPVAPPVEPAPVTPEPTAPVQEQDAFDVLTQRINEAAQANQQAAPQIPQPTVIDPVQEARERLRTMMPQSEPVAPEIPAPAAPVRESQPVQQEPTPVQERTEAPVEEEPVKTHKAWRKGRMFEAVETDDGIYVRRKPNHRAQWNAWEKVDTLDTMGLRPLDRPSVKIPGVGTFKTEFEADTVVEPKGPPTILNELAAGPQLNRAAFMAEFGIDLPDTKGRRESGLRGVFTDNGGLTPDGLWEWAIENNFLVDEGFNNGTTNETDFRNAWDIVSRALDGERIVNPRYEQAETDYQAELRDIEEWTLAEEIAAEDQDVAVTVYREASDEIDGSMPIEEVMAAADEYYRSIENVEQESGQGNLPGRVEEETSGLIPEPTQAEQLRAEAERKTAERNRLGQDEVPVEQGEGELFAGNEAGVRPTQADAFDEKPAPKRPGWLRQDNPAVRGNTEWLENKKEQVIEGGRKNEVPGKPYNRLGTVTGSVADGNKVPIPTSTLTQINGLNGEQENVRQDTLDWFEKNAIIKDGNIFLRKFRQRTDEEVEAFNESGKKGNPYWEITEEFEDRTSAPFIVVDQDGRAWVNEGNHRIMEAARRGEPFLNVEIRWYNGSEMLDGPWSPASVDALRQQAEQSRQPPDVPSEPKQAAATAPEEGKTSTKNAVTNAEREARNESPAFFSFRESNAELVGRAEQELKDNPDAAQELISRLLDEADPSINRLDLAILMVYKTDIRQAMARQGDRLQNNDLTEEQRAVAIKKISDLDVTMDQIDQAAVVAGAVWGGWGQLRSKFMLEDYTLETQIARTSQMIQGAVTPEMKTFLEEATNRISKLENELADQNRKMQDEIDRRVSAEVQIQMAKRIAGEMKKPAQTAKKKLREARNAEIEWLKQHSAQLNALPVEHVYHLARLGGVIMAEGAIEFAVWVERLKQYLGGKLFGQIEGSIDEIYALAQDEYHKVESEVERPSVDDVLVEAEALAEIDEPVTHRVVYKLVEAFLAQGLRGESQVMQAVHSALQPVYPDLTESDVRHLFTEYGKAKFPSEEELKVLAREMKVLVRLGISIERLQNGLAPLRTGPQRDKATQKIREKQRVLNWLMREMDRKNPNPTRRSLASINEQRVRRLENQIADLEKQIKTGEKPPKRKTPLEDSPEVATLKKKRDALKKHLADIEAAKKPELSPEEKYNVMRGKQLRRQLADIRRRLREKDYARHPRKQMPALSRENVELQGEIAKAKFELHMKQMEWQRQEMSGFQKTWDATKQFSSLARASMTSTDLSAVGRQGGFLLYASPNTARKAFMPMIRSIRSDADAHAIMQEIEARPNYRYMQAANIFFSDQMGTDWKSFEEVFQSRWQEHFPHIKISARAYTAFLNKMRADHFDAIYNRLTRSGPLTKEELLDLGDFINNATGRADLGRFSSEGISSIFFAPRWVISRFNMILYPLKAAGMLPGKSGKRMSARIRKEVARQLVNFVSSYIILWGLLGFMFGDEADEDDPLISFDPFSPDFAKLKIGNTRMDITAGLSNAVRFTAMSLDAAWDAVSGTGEIDDARRYGRYLMRFMWSKLAPIPSSTVNSMVGHNVVGETPKERGEFLSETLKLPDWLAEHRVLLEVLGWSIPLSLRDFYDSAVDAGIPPAIAFQVFSTLGWGIVTYERDEDKKGGRPERPERPQRPSRPERPERG